MTKYVYSYISFFDNVMTSVIIESDKTAFEIAKEQCELNDWQVYEDITTLEALKQFAFECDFMFEIIEV
jgi:hypothetical protein